MDRHKKIHKEKPPTDEKPKSSFDFINELYGLDSHSKKKKDNSEKPHFKKPEPVVFEKTLNNIKYTIIREDNRERRIAQNTTGNPVMIEVIVNDRHGRKERIKCFPSDTILTLKKLISAKLGTRLEKIRLQRGNSVLSDLVSLDDYEINSGSSLEIYYN